MISSIPLLATNDPSPEPGASASKEAGALAGAVSLHLQGRREEALKALESQPEEAIPLPETHFARGRICYELGRYEE
ncbi:MAG: hypothetical protein LC126_21710, partial [Bryobacterales bacterium]|nr:hypothetical protein [Bryobacterales bacterium]